MCSQREYRISPWGLLTQALLEPAPLQTHAPFPASRTAWQWGHLPGEGGKRKRDRKMLGLGPANRIRVIPSARAGPLPAPLPLHYTAHSSAIRRINTPDSRTATLACI